MNRTQDRGKQVYQVYHSYDVICDDDQIFAADGFTVSIVDEKDTDDFSVDVESVETSAIKGILIRREVDPVNFDFLPK